MPQPESAITGVTTNNEIILNYQLHLIKNIHDEEILKNGDNNKKEIVLEALV